MVKFPKTELKKVTVFYAACDAQLTPLPRMRIDLQCRQILILLQNNTLSYFSCQRICLATQILAFEGNAATHRIISIFAPIIGVFPLVVEGGSFIQRTQTAWVR